MTRFFNAALAGLLAATLTTSGCGTYSLAQMRDVFQSDVRDQIGEPFGQLTAGEFSFIGVRKPTDVKHLQHGNTLYVYGGYWVQYNIPRKPCTVFLEVDPKTKIVANAYSKGSGCYRPY